MDRSPVPGPAVEREGRGNNDGSTLTFPKASNSALISASIWVISFVLRCILLFWYLSLYSLSLYCPVLVAYHTLRLCDNPGPWYYILIPNRFAAFFPRRFSITPGLYEKRRNSSRLCFSGRTGYD